MTTTTKRHRRTKADIQLLRTELHKIIAEQFPMTVRQVFYQAVSRGLIEKCEKQYKGTIVRLLTDMRLAGELPFHWIADNTRWMRKPRTFSGLAQMMEFSQETYRRAVWDNQEAYVEVWLEKEALAGVLSEVTSTWDVPLMVCRGYPSLSYLHSAAMAIKAQERPSYLYYFGDHDPSGVDIPRYIRDRITELIPDADFELSEVAVKEWQIDAWNLPTRPTKKSDTRAKSFGNRSVEVDAIPPAKLRQLTQQCIEQHVDQRALIQLKLVEQAERVTLKNAFMSLGQQNDDRGQE